MNYGFEAHAFVFLNERQTQGFTVLEVDTDKSHLFGHKWKDMGAYGKRKWETLVVVSRPKERLKFSYPV